MKTTLEPEDFYYENGKIVLTEKFLLKREKCCNNNCRHCPYKKDKRIENKLSINRDSDT